MYGCSASSAMLSSSLSVISSADFGPTSIRCKSEIRSISRHAGVRITSCVLSIAVLLLQHLADFINRISGFTVDSRELRFKNCRAVLQDLLTVFKGIYAHEDNIAFPVFGNIDRLLTLMRELRDRIIIISQHGRGFD